MYNSDLLPEHITICFHVYQSTTQAFNLENLPDGFLQSRTNSAVQNMV
jgi:hypothetical protein